ncbi:MAG: hypothetical protein JST22_01590 [Bacteroidetes bacterium]|nr:hypothetical protein [Bacteroidota bacterium]
MEYTIMLISIINHTGGEIQDIEVQEAVRAINRQIREDFAPVWGMSATLRLEGRSALTPDTTVMADMRGDAVIYLWNESDVDDAIGYHLQNYAGIPYGFVFTRIAEQLHEPWSVTLSHEAMELIADPETNLLVMGPHPSENRQVFYWFEMCDAVQNDRYEIDGIAVSNFVQPLYFTGTRATDEPGARNDFLGEAHNGQTLASFGINPGGYIGFYDPILQKHETYTRRDDPVALKRLEIKGAMKLARRAVRYQSGDRREMMQRDVMKRMPVLAARRARGAAQRVEYRAVETEMP